MHRRIHAIAIVAALLSAAACGDDSTGRHIDGDGGVPPNTFVYDPGFCEAPVEDRPALRELTVRADSSGDFETIQACVDQAQPGDHCVVYPGQYGRVEVLASGTAENFIVVRSAQGTSVDHVQTTELYDPANPVALPGDPAANAVTRGFSLEASYVRVQGFEVTAVYAEGLPFPGRGAIGMRDCSHVEVLDNLIHDANAEPDSYNYIGIRGETHTNTDILVRGNMLLRNQGTAIGIFGSDWRVDCNDISHTLDTNTDTGIHVGGDSDAIRFFGTNHYIRYNYIHDLLDEEQAGDPHIDAFQVFTVYPESQFAHDIYIQGNYVYNSGQMLMASDEAEEGGGEDALSRITFNGNVFRRTRAMAIIVASFTDHVTFMNNVVTEAYYTGISITGGSHHAVVLNNIFYWNGISHPLQPTGQSLLDEVSRIGSLWDHNLHYPDFTWPEKHPDDDIHGLYGVDPLFMDFDNEDYRVIGSSPACGAGYEGADIGAYPCVRCTDATPVPYMVTSRRTGWEPLVVDFDASYSLACGDNPTYAWDFGDGGTAGGASARHVFGPGQFQVTLTVTNDNGGSAAVARPVSVEPSVLPNLVLGLHLDGDITDWSGKGNVVAWENGDGAYGSGISGQGASFDGSEGGARLSVEHHYLLDDLEQMTIVFWAMKNDPAGGEEVVLKHTSYMVRIEEDGFRADIYNETDSVSLTATGQPTADTQWHFYAVTYDGATVRLWLDGAEVDNAAFSGRVARNVDRPVDLGGDPWGAAFDGLMDEIRIYDKALSAAEISDLYTAY